ncbi:hypothetical protein ACFY0N_00910 [Streptomyces vinaceus]|uniref:hypothetical protein n=1 Tax=Streptomyces vinaceus TaxID=1960 RepID=UPI0036AEDDA8
MNRRDYCRCTRVRNYTYDQAAKKLGCARRWLEDNISRLPRQKYGQNPVFCECELALIRDMFSILPEKVAEFIAAVTAELEPCAAEPAGEQEQPERVLTLAQISPAPPRRSTRTA